MSDDTMQASSGDEPETAEVPAETAKGQLLAWSQDDGTDDQGPQWRSWRSVWAIVGVIAACSAVAGAGVWVARTHHGSAPPPAAAPHASVTVPAPTPAPPPAAVPAPTSAAVEPTPVELTDTDRQFISKLHNGGIEYPFSNPGYPIGKAHAVCDYEAAHQQVAPGVDKSAQGGKWVEENTIWYGDNAVAFSSLAQATYCPQYLDGEY